MGSHAEYAPPHIFYIFNENTRINPKVPKAESLENLACCCWFPGLVPGSPCTQVKKQTTRLPHPTDRLVEVARFAIAHARQIFFLKIFFCHHARFPVAMLFKCISIHAMGQPVLLEKGLIAPAPMLSPTTDVSFGIFII